ncbi:MAG: 16S rRNA (guanine(966)-N(2))-methyltransferase RsmD [Bacilli bacterium]|nr:16S rRNA (guanine(966)-N(2))-methyltransferase RsmD [Bacilli bacterium]
MKVISGKYKGRVLEGFDMVGTRPTMDRVKESLFAMIQDSISDSVVLDLFAGSGNLGVEALSQGASFSYFVDSNRKAVQTIERNLSKIRILDAKVFCFDYLKALAFFASEKIFFDIIFLDPPYQSNYLEKSIAVIDEKNLMNEHGLIVCESDQLDKIIYSSHFQPVKEKKYGDKYIVILQKVC